MKKFLTRLTLITLISALIVPIINTAAIWPLYIVTSSDTITYPSLLGNILHYVYVLLNDLLPYAVIFCLSYSFFERCERVKTSLIAIISPLVVNTTTVLVDIAFNNDISVPELVEINAQTYLFELVRLFASTFLTLKLLGLLRAKKRGGR